MSISLKINNKPNITKEKFLCDVKIHKKLEKFPLVDEHLNQFNTTAFIGSQGSGKTSLVIQMVKKLYKKCFHRIYVFMPSYSRSSLDDNIFEKLPNEQIFDELNEATMEDVYEKIKANSAEGLYSLIIYDDVQKALKDKYVLNSLKNIVANQRHLKVVNFIILQNFFSLDIRLRELINNIILFKVKKTQIERVFNEYVESHKDKFLEVMHYVYDKPHQWLFLNIQSQRMYKQFDELIFNDDDDALENLSI